MSRVPCVLLSRVSCVPRVLPSLMSCALCVPCVPCPLGAAIPGAMCAQCAAIPGALCPTRAAIPGALCPPRAAIPVCPVSPVWRHPQCPVSPVCCHPWCPVSRVPWVLPSPVSRVPWVLPSLVSCVLCPVCPPCAAIPAVPCPLGAAIPGVPCPLGDALPCVPRVPPSPAVSLSLLCCRLRCPLSLCPPPIPCPRLPLLVSPVSPSLPRGLPSPSRPALPGCPAVGPWRLWPTSTSSPWPTGTGGPAATASPPPPSSSSAAGPSAGPWPWPPAWPRGCAASAPSASPPPPDCGLGDNPPRCPLSSVPADVAYLRSVLPSTTEDAFFDYLATLDASEVTVSAMPEGSVVFARVPFLQVKGPLLVVQLLETTLLCLVNYASLVATNAARFRLLAGPDMKLMEIGLRRAQGPDGALSASKYSYIGGFDYTSNILAGKLYGIPVCGTIAHSFIMSFTSLEEVRPRELSPLAGGEPVDLPGLAERWLQRVCELLRTPPEKANQGELAAFVSYAATFPRDFQGLLDTYCVRRSGLPNFCAVALALHQLGYRAIGVRLDSGDLAQQSKEIRRVLRACGAHFQVPWFETIPIAVSNDISEQSLEEFSREGSEINVIGVGTNLVTCPLQPSLGCVYKLVEVNGSPCLKLTEDEEKMTIPGTKTIYRLYDAAGV
ncbi:nicotinate phosphoribosyltransferase isoform X2 [Larus michahellis]|uniref:nicotinate phosphoribosyltransferase isoform X2 n=1 Tax=Larus michahellis TaxID=119627 RepID=UPI003D9B4594